MPILSLKIKSVHRFAVTRQAARRREGLVAGETGVWTVAEMGAHAFCQVT